MNFIIKLFLSAISIVIGAYLLPGVTIEGFWSAIIVAALLSLLNVTVKPLLIIFTIPLTVLTLGLFLIVINVLMILLADSIVDGFFVRNFWWALGFSIILSILNSLFEDLVGKKNN